MTPYSDEYYEALDNEVERICESDYEIAEAIKKDTMRVAGAYWAGGVDQAIYDLICEAARNNIDKRSKHDCDMGE